MTILTLHQSALRDSIADESFIADALSIGALPILVAIVASGALVELGTADLRFALVTRRTWAGSVGRGVGGESVGAEGRARLTVAHVA